MSQEELKKAAALAALDYIEEDMIVGVGTGSTTAYFIEGLATIKNKIAGTVASSKASTDHLKSLGIPVYELNGVNQVHIYIDGADQANSLLELIKGGGGALTQEKVIANEARQFICIADETKMEPLFGSYPLPVEVIPMARSFVARQIVKLGGDPAYREHYLTDNGNIILDIHNLKLLEPIKIEKALNDIPGVVCNGLFALRPADLLLLGTKQGVKVLKQGF